MDIGLFACLCVFVLEFAWNSRPIFDDVINRLSHRRSSIWISRSSHVRKKKWATGSWSWNGRRPSYRPSARRKIDGGGRRNRKTWRMRSGRPEIPGTRTSESESNCSVYYFSFQFSGTWTKCCHLLASHRFQRYFRRCPPSTRLHLSTLQIRHPMQVCSQTRVRGKFNSYVHALFI